VTQSLEFEVEVQLQRFKRLFRLVPPPLCLRPGRIYLFDSPFGSNVVTTGAMEAPPSSPMRPSTVVKGGGNLIASAVESDILLEGTIHPYQTVCTE
jgi:hypothetical protein